MRVLLDVQDLAMPSLEQEHGRKRARVENDAAGAPTVAPAGEREAATLDGLIAPNEECAVCLNPLERPTITPCSHWFCRSFFCIFPTLLAYGWHVLHNCMGLLTVRYSLLVAQVQYKTSLRVDLIRRTIVAYITDSKPKHLRVAIHAHA